MTNNHSLLPSYFEPVVKEMGEFLSCASTTMEGARGSTCAIAPTNQSDCFPLLSQNLLPFKSTHFPSSVLCCPNDSESRTVPPTTGSVVQQTAVQTEDATGSCLRGQIILLSETLFPHL